MRCGHGAMGTIPDVAQVLMIPVHQIYVSTMAEDNSVTGYESERLKTEFRETGARGKTPYNTVWAPLRGAFC